MAALDPRAGSRADVYERGVHVALLAPLDEAGRVDPPSLAALPPVPGLEMPGAAHGVPVAPVVRSAHHADAAAADRVHPWLGTVGVPLGARA